jgi:radical SAM superfamily enzyme YgiQ (UPF0313 family)
VQIAKFQKVFQKLIMTIDIALVSIPRLNIDAPPMGIASIKASVISAGFSARCFDLNISLYHSVSFDMWLELDNYFQTDLRYTGTSLDGAGSRSINFINIVEKRKKDLKCYNEYTDFLEKEILKILSTNPTWIGLSVFSVNSVISTVNFLLLLKKIKPEQKVIAGGMGLSSFGLGGNSNFGEFLINEGLITTYIAGEGEHAIIDLLKNNLGSRISPQIDNLDKLPFPDYNDFDFSLYPGKENMIYVTGSRGCVRACTFCDINSLWKKFRYRSGDNIAKEILQGYKKYSTLDFYFTDSLINGNMKEFLKLLDTIIDYKEAGLLPDELMFGGQFIARPKSRFPEEYYKKMQKAGVYNISVGLESGSDRVLSDMRKGTTREDHDFMMQMLEKYGIRINLLMLVGYPTETEEDFEQTLQMIRDYKRYSDNGIIWGIVLGKTMVVLPNTPIADNADHWSISYDESGNWVSNKNPTLTYHERVKRRMRAGRLCEDLGYVIKSQVVTVNSLHEIVTRGGYDSIA